MLLLSDKRETGKYFLLKGRSFSFGLYLDPDFLFASRSNYRVQTWFVPLLLPMVSRWGGTNPSTVLLHLHRKFGTPDFYQVIFDSCSHSRVTGRPTTSALVSLTQGSMVARRLSVCNKHYFLFYFFLFLLPWKLISRFYFFLVSIFWAVQLRYAYERGCRSWIT